MTDRAKPSRLPFTPTQRRLLLALAAAVALRMLGLALVLPIMSLYALQFTGSRFLAGLAFGAYGLTMAVLQMPFGRLSDRLGRRRILIAGMLVFSLGSFLCAVPAWFPAGGRIAVLILGRLVQGGGAIISVAFAAAADQIEPERRSLAMAVLGIPIGGAFIVGVIAGPALAGLLGPPFLFWLTGLLGLGALLPLARYLPGVPVREVAAPPPPRRLPALRVLAPAGLLMNLIMAVFFFYFPLIVSGQHHLTMTHYYRLLVPMVLISGVTMLAFSRSADRGRARPLGALAFALFAPATAILFWPAGLGFGPGRLTSVLIAGTLFYVAFTGLEPILPSLVSRSVPQTAYGTALGLYNSMQFLGSFAGGAAAGALARLPPIYTTTLLIAAASLGCWLLLSGHGSPGPAAT
jgi:MFS family permease